VDFHSPETLDMNSPSSMSLAEREEFNSLSRRFLTIDSKFEELKNVNADIEKEQEKQSIVIARLRSETDVIKSNMSEIQRDLRILHPLPYARLYLQKCIDGQIDCNDAVNAFIDRCATASANIYSSDSLTLQLRELKKELKKAWESRFAAAHLCELPPTLANVLHIVA